MTGGDDQYGVVIAPETAEEANRVATALRAGGFSPVVDYRAQADRLGTFPVTVPGAELAEAKGFLRGLRAGQQAAALAAPSPGLPAAQPAYAMPAPAPRSGLLPGAGRALALLTGVLVIAGGVVALANMLQTLNSLRYH